MLRTVLFCCLILASVAAPASAQQFFAEPFLTDFGQYTTGDLVYQNPFVPGFLSAWYGGLNGPSAAYDVTSTGLSWTDTSYGQSGGSVVYSGSGTTGMTESLIREFVNPVTTAFGTYFMSGLMSFDAGFAATPGASAFTGLLNAEEGDGSVPWVIGTQWGFRANETGGVDAVVRNRSVIGENEFGVAEDILATDLLPGTHLFIIQVNPDYSGGSADRCVFWLNPEETGNEFALGAPTLAVSKVNFLSPTAPERIVDTLVLSATDVPSGANVGFDEIRMGTALEDVVTVSTEPVATSPIEYREGLFQYEHVAVEVRGSSANDYENRNFDGRDELLVGCTPGAPFRTLFSFTLDYIPEGATITEVELELTVKRTDGAATHPIELRLTNPPQELVEREVTYLLAAAGVPFTVPGGDFTDTVLGTMDGITSEEVGETKVFESNSALVAAAQAAFDSGMPLQMGMISPGIEEANIRNFYGFFSDDGPLSYAPLLRVTFDDGSGPGPGLEGDLNGDGLVGSADLDIVRANWGETVEPGCVSCGDPSGDGLVGSADLDIVRANWGATAPASIPEPGSWTLLVLVGLFVAARRRNH